MSDNFRHCPKRLRESVGVTIVWGDEDMSLADLFASSSTFRMHVRERALANFVRRTERVVDELESELKLIQECLEYELP